MISHSQLGQDNKVVEIYKRKRDGYFVEIGASDGVEFSNTCMLEREFGWKGICVEPIEEEFEKLVVNRPNSICLKKAVFSESNRQLQFTIADCKFLSGITDCIDKWKEHTANGRIVTVTTITVNDMLEQCGAPDFIDYLSLDTEGTEFEILKAIDFTKYRFGIIDLEHNYLEPKRSEMRAFLVSKGYVYNGENFVDDQYVHPSIF
jgi:FkbM family methyltransferase